MRRLWPAWLGLAAALLVSACGPFGPQGATKGTVEVLAVGAFGASATSPGAVLSASLNYEAQRLNSASGADGYRLKVVHVDDGGNVSRDPALVAAATRKGGARLVVGAFDSSGLQALAPVLAQRGLLACTYTPVAAASLAPKREFGIVSDDASAQAVLGYAAQSKHVQAVGLIATNDASGQQEDRIVAAAAAALHLHYTGARLVPAGQVDQSPQIRSEVGAGAQAIVLSTNVTVAGRTATSLYAMGLKSGPLLLGLSQIAAYPFAQLAGPGAQGAVLAATNDSYLTVAPSRGWSAAYRGFLTQMVSDFGTAIDGFTPLAQPASADCLTGWAAATNAASSLAPGPVAASWGKVNLAPGNDLLGMREAYSGQTAVDAKAMAIYGWNLTAGRWKLQPL